MQGLPILSIMTFIPLAGAVLIMLVRAVTAGQSESGSESRAALQAGLLTTITAFIASLFMFLNFDAGVSAYQMVEDLPWFDGRSTVDGIVGGVRYKMGVDGLSVLLIMLTTFLMPLCILASWSSIKERVTEYVVAFLILETMMLGVFCALDLVLFYFFFEAGLIPMFIIIGVWGGADRIYASYKFFLYTLLGSLFMLAAVVFMYIQAGTSDIQVLEKFEFAKEAQIWLWLAFAASFAVKLPMWPVHTWLPDAHVQAPTAGSVILAGVLLKMGGYGFLRFSLPMFPDASAYFQPFMFGLAVIAIVYTSLVAFRQTDMKKLIAYSSVAHMGFVTLGIFSFTQEGVQGAIFQMLSHGLISSALFLLVGVIYDRMHTREIAFYGGLVNRMPVYATLFMLFTMANVGLPGTSGFVGEFLTMLGAFRVETWAAVGAALGVIFSAVYMLRLYRETVFGDIENTKLLAITDMNSRELITIVPLAIGTILFGIAPWLLMNVTMPATERILAMMGGN